MPNTCTNVLPTRCCCRVLQCVTVHYSALQFVAVYCSILQCIAVCCSMLQYVAVCCSMLQYVAVYSSVLLRVAVCCNVLQCVAEALVCNDAFMHQRFNNEMTYTHAYTHTHTHTHTHCKVLACCVSLRRGLSFGPKGTKVDRECFATALRAVLINSLITEWIHGERFWEVS